MLARECSTAVTATTCRPRSRAPIAISIGTLVDPLALKIIITSSAPKVKLLRICSARPSTRSMNMACRCPLAPTTCVWKVIDSSAMGWKPGKEP